MPDEPESLGAGLGSLLADYIPLLPSGARRAGAARVMAARVGRDPSFLVNDPIKTQLAALGIGSIGNVYAKGQGAPIRTAATVLPILLVQALRRREIRSIQNDYDTEDRKRLRELDTSELFGGLGGSSRLGAVGAYEAMRKRKYQDIGALSEVGDAMTMATAGASLPVTSWLDHRSADRMQKQAQAPWRQVGNLAKILKRTGKYADEVGEGMNLASLKQRVGGALSTPGKDKIGQRVVRREEAARAQLLAPFRGDDDLLKAERNRIRTRTSHEKLFDKYGQDVPTSDGSVYRGAVGGDPWAGGAYDGAFRYASPTREGAAYYGRTEAPYAEAFRMNKSSPVTLAPKREVIHHYEAPSGQKTWQRWGPEELLTTSAKRRNYAAKNDFEGRLGSAETTVMPKYNPFQGTEVAINDSAKFFPAGRPSNAARNYIEQTGQMVSADAAGNLNLSRQQVGGLNTTPWQTSVNNSPVLLRLQQRNPQTFKSIMARRAGRLLSPDINKQADFADQKNSPTIPLYLAAALASTGGLAAAGAWTQHEFANTPALEKKEWSPLVRHVSSKAPPVYNGGDMGGNAFYTKPTSDQQRENLARHLQGMERVEPLAKEEMMLVRDKRNERRMLVNRLRGHGAIVADTNSSAGVLAHEAGHAKIEATPGVLQFLQRHLYHHKDIIAPAAGIGSMAAGLASGSTLNGALLGTGIGLVSGLGTIAPEAAASYYGLKGLQDYKGGALSGGQTSPLVAALSTYLAAGVLPSTLAGAAGGWISGKRRAKAAITEDEDAEG